MTIKLRYFTFFFTPYLVQEGLLAVLASFRVSISLATVIEVLLTDYLKLAHGIMF